MANQPYLILPQGRNRTLSTAFNFFRTPVVATPTKAKEKFATTLFPRSEERVVERSKDQVS
jgi:hypothetical protein